MNERLLPSADHEVGNSAPPGILSITSSLPLPSAGLTQMPSWPPPRTEPYAIRFPSGDQTGPRPALPNVRRVRMFAAMSYVQTSSSPPLPEPTENARLLPSGEKRGARKRRGDRGTSTASPLRFTMASVRCGSEVPGA